MICQHVQAFPSAAGARSSSQALLTCVSHCEAELSPGMCAGQDREYHRLVPATPICSKRNQQPTAVIWQGHEFWAVAGHGARTAYG